MQGSGFDNFITCSIPFEEKDRLSLITVGSTITVTGTYSKRIGDYIVLTNIVFGKTEEPKKAAAKQNVPQNIPLGSYNVYIYGSTGLARQSDFTLNSYSTYTIWNRKANCNYNETTKVIKFTSGVLAGQTGFTAR